MYSIKEDSMTIPVSVYMWHQTTPIETLLDSGATHNFIDKRTIDALHIGTKTLPQPLRVNNVDGTENRAGRITHFCNLWVGRETHVHKLGFYVANLGRDRIILGHPWFKTFNPTIDWTTNRLRGPDVRIETAGYRHKIETEVTTQVIEPSPPLTTDEEEKIDPSIPEHYRKHWEVFSEKASN